MPSSGDRQERKAGMLTKVFLTQFTSLHVEKKHKKEKKTICAHTSK